MEENSRDESGRFSRGVEDGDILAAVRAHDPAATSEIAEEVGISRQGADRRLRELRNAGKVSSKKIGASLVWFMPREHGRPSTWGSPDAPSDGESDRSDTRGDTPPTDTGAESADTRPESDTLAEDVSAYLEREDVPPKTEHGRSAVVDVFRYLREHGTAKTAAIQDAVHPEYAEEWSTGRTMWNALDRYLPDVPGVEKGGYGEWEYTGDDAVREQLEL